MRYSLIIILGILFGCSQKNVKEISNTLKPSLISLVVRDMSSSTHWYKNLGFAVDTTMHFPEYGLEIRFLKQGDFKLELIEFEDQIRISKEQLPSVYSNIHGIIKMGFLVSDLDSIVASYSNSDSSIIAGPDELPELTSGYPWPSSYFLVSDPDGNYVQFFEWDEEMESVYSFNQTKTLTPFLMMLSVKDFEGAQDWYKNLGFDVIEKIENPGNQRALLFNGNFVIELGSFADDRNLEEVGIEKEDFDKVIRMSKVGFSTFKIDSLYEAHSSNGFEFYYQNMGGDEQNFIVEDLEGNYIQIFRFD